MDIKTISRQFAEGNDKILVLKSCLELLKKDETFARELWDINELPLVILQIITDSFYILSTPQFNKEKSDEVKVCIDILRSLIEVGEIRDFFLNAKLDYYIYPFLMSATDESLKISTLCLFSAILKEGLPESMKGSELLPLLLKIVDSDSEVCQIMALQTMDLVLIDAGLDYAVQTIDRFQAIDVVLSAILTKAIFANNKKLVKILLKIYSRLCDKPNVYHKLKEKIPEGLDSKEIIRMCEDDKEIKELRSKFFKSI